MTFWLRDGKAITICNIKTFIEDGFVERSETMGPITDDFFKSPRLKRDSRVMTPKQYRKYENVF